MAAGIPELLEDLGMLYHKEDSKRKARYGLYKCVCGTIFKSQIGDVKRGTTQSCGCYRTEQIKKANTTHGHTENPLYSVWCNMVYRVTNPKATNYKYYGEKGITISEEWYDVNNFIKDMSENYEEGLTIDRIDNDKGYSKENCRWTTKSQQSRNTRQIMSTNTSGYRGVVFHKQRQKWIAQINVLDKHIHIGIFDNKLDAAIAYDTYVIEHNLGHTLNNVMEVCNG